MTSRRICSTCGTALASSALHGACPVCLSALALRACSSAHLPSTPFTPPAITDLSSAFADLEIHELLGVGGMGAVYSARQTKLDRLVALKILPPERARDPDFTERFLREARALARLNHPHIVSVYDTGQAGAYLYILMEYVEGASLRDLIRDGKLDACEAMRLVPQICDAMQYAHDQGVIHRDIKPENILIDQHGQVKIADFSLAKVSRGAADSAALTTSNQRMGTLRYMAPEQLNNSARVDRRADIYSLGVTFYEMLTGTLPTLDFKPPSRVAEVDARVDRVVVRSIKESPEDRYQQALEVKKAVERIAASPRWPWRLGAATGAGLLLAVGIVLALCGPFWGSRPEGDLAGPVGGEVKPAAVTAPGAAAPRDPPPLALRFQLGGRVEIPLQLPLLQDVTLEAYVTPLQENYPEPTHIVGVMRQCSLFLDPKHKWDLGLEFPQGFHHIGLATQALPGREYHVAGVRQGEHMTLFVDGKRIGSKSVPTGALAAREKRLLVMGSNRTPLQIRAVRISTSARYSQNFTPAPRWTADAETLALYEGDEGQGDVFKDISGNGHHGKILGAKWVSATDTTIPTVAVAPFAPKQAEAQQQACAQRLGVPVEITNTVGMKLRLIPPGKLVLPRGFSRGPAPTSDEIAEPFYAGVYEVTVGQYRQFVQASRYRTAAEVSPEGGMKLLLDKPGTRHPKYCWSFPEFSDDDQRPVAVVNWHDATAFCRWLSGQEKRSYRLPTETEWLWLTRSSSSGTFFFGDDVAELAKYAWYKQADERCRPVGLKLPNPWGLYDVYGNMFELSYDWQSADFKRRLSPATNPQGPKDPERQVVFGGGFIDDPCWAGGNFSGASMNHVGFRVILTSTLTGEAR
jgi:formylglycine-generating enzyme required for sulfatase activity/tRNA A-37 threonylcarbamoyl transferase component Bud32